MPTPSTFTRGNLLRSGMDQLGCEPSCSLQLFLDPVVRDLQAVCQPSLGLPAQHNSQPGVVAVPSAYPLWLVQRVDLAQPFACDFAYHVHQPIDTDQFLGTQVERSMIVACH